MKITLDTWAARHLYPRPGCARGRGSHDVRSRGGDIQGGGIGHRR